jgi:hypothetical protein
VNTTCAHNDRNMDSNNNNDYVSFIHSVKLKNLLQSKENAVQEKKRFSSYSPSTVLEDRVPGPVSPRRPIPHVTVRTATSVELIR